MSVRIAQGTVLLQLCAAVGVPLCVLAFTEPAFSHFKESASTDRFDIDLLIGVPFAGWIAVALIVLLWARSIPVSAAMSLAVMGLV